METILNKYNLTLNIYKLHVNEKANNDVNEIEYRLSKIYIGNKHSKIARENTIHLLYYKKHFFLINNLISLSRYVTKRVCKHKEEICYRCLEIFDTRFTNIKNHEECCSRDSKGMHTYPPKGKTLHFKRYQVLNKNWVFIVSDFECSHNKELIEESNTNNSEETSVHCVNSYALLAYVEPDLYQFPYEEFNKIKKTD